MKRDWMKRSAVTVLCALMVAVSMPVQVFAEETHIWVMTDCQWSDSCDSVGVSFECSDCGLHDYKTVRGDDITAVYTEGDPQTCATYTAHINGPDGTSFESQKDGLHSWDVDGAVWQWAADCSTASVTVKCRNHSSHTQTLSAVPKEIERLEPTATVEGYIIYEATSSISDAQGDHLLGDTRRVTLPATGGGGSSSWTVQ